MNDDRGNFYSGWGPGGYGPWNPMGMMAEQWLAAMRAWTQAWSAFVPDPWRQAGASPFSTHPDHVTLKVAASSPVECGVNLSAGPEGQPLVCEPLYAEGFSAPAIEAPTVLREPGVIQVSVRVPAQQSAGRYRGLIRRQGDQSVAGELSVVVSSATSSAS